MQPKKFFFSYFVPRHGLKKVGERKTEKIVFYSKFGRYRRKRALFSGRGAPGGGVISSLVNNSSGCDLLQTI